MEVIPWFGVLLYRRSLVRMGEGIVFSAPLVVAASWSSFSVKVKKNIFFKYLVSTGKTYYIVKRIFFRIRFSKFSNVSVARIRLEIC